MIRPIAISLSPNTQFRDIILTVRLLFSPWVSFGDNYVRLLEQWFRQFFNVSYAISFNSGRGGELTLLRALNIGEKDEVIIQSFTCVAVVNSIIALGARPVFVDIEESLIMNSKDLEGKISKKTKAIIVQHTFGIPSNLLKVKKIAKKNKIPIIEDCAHVIGGILEGKKLGTLCDAAFFSFGRDKAFSSIFGGMVITDNSELGLKLRNLQKQLSKPKLAWVLQQLFHPLIFYLMILPLYDVLSLGKVILILLQKLKLLSSPVTKEEKEGIIDKLFAAKMSNTLASLALFQLKRVREFNLKREELASIYIDNLDRKYYTIPSQQKVPYLRFPVIFDKRDNVVDFLKRKNIYVGKWYSEIIDPKGVDFKKIFYQRGSCPNSEYVAKKIINLPTYPTMRLDDAKKIVHLLNNYAKNKGN